MNYIIPKGDFKPEKRIMAPALGIMPGEKSASFELMKLYPNMTAYGMLLLDDPDHPLAELVRERWSEIHNMTGDNFLLFSFDRPAEWAQNYMKYWQNKLNDQFETTLEKWQEVPDPGAAYSYMSLFKPALTPKQLPCLVLFTDPEERQVVVRPIPDWSKESLLSLLKGIVTVVNESADKSKEERLEWLRKELTSPSARFKAAAGHVSSLAQDYFKQHPALVTSTLISVVLGLSGAGVFTLPTVAVSALGVLKETLSSAKSPGK